MTTSRRPISDVPMPPNVSVTPPSEGLDPRLKALSGSWEGFWGGARASRLVVETIDEAEATVAYGIVEHGDGERAPYRRSSRRHTAQVSPDGSLTFGAPGPFVLTFAIAPNGVTVEGTHRTNGVIGGRVTMRRSAEAPAAPVPDGPPA